jgi:putative heme degradation protein
MAITEERAQELIESVFDFDHVGTEMLAVRKNFDSAEAHEALVEEFVNVGMEELNDPLEENKAMVTAAAKSRVDQFVKGAKFSQSGCSGLK